MRILIITGGYSPESEISLMSAEQVEGALKDKGHSVDLHDLRLGYNILKEIAPKFDIFFPVLHGEEGEGGVLHKFLVTLKKPIVGTNNYEALQSGWHKIPFKEFCKKNKILTPKFRIVTSKDEIIKFGFPCVLKSNSGGSSLEVAIIKTKKDIDDQMIDEILSLDEKFFVEEFISGVEVTVGILGDKALPVIEIVPPDGEWFDYKNKYSGKVKEIPFAPSLSNKFQKEIQSIALKIHKELDLGSYSRVDFMTKGNKAYAIEVNTIPGLTKNSLLPKAAKADGMSFPEFVERLLEMTKKKRKTKKRKKK